MWAGGSVSKGGKSKSRRVVNGLSVVKKNALSDIMIVVGIALNGIGSIAMWIAPKGIALTDRRSGAGISAILTGTICPVGGEVFGGTLGTRGGWVGGG
jgi:hypothetical protein